MIPDRFVTEYPARCLKLLAALELKANELDLIGTFTVLLATSMLTVPFERLRIHHPLFQDPGGLAGALAEMFKRPWCEAVVCAGASPAEWRFSRIMGDPNEVGGWRDEAGRPSMSVEANTIAKRTSMDVVRVLRNALAHGNIVYLDEDGRETAGARVAFLGFLSRYEENQEQRARGETYRLVAVRETHLLRFIKNWAGWIAQFNPDDGFRH
ncbi:hypothetical protein OKW76_12175 [Sphingomonas sp. S1-29]|uniref:hypothetical protein n=1 Tax=Sphingomonas sp. S1-29 TaxID=2991074 RepID=UPI0022401C09|nr:hypothetical protein [Sphingomonas sp. S1-29]UZK68791.1 hypothetical protein OKW76_12175 [Sphingomonas sp. S1-29]